MERFNFITGAQNSDKHVIEKHDLSDQTNGSKLVPGRTNDLLTDKKITANLHKRHTLFNVETCLIASSSFQVHSRNVCVYRV